MGRGYKMFRTTLFNHPPLSFTQNGIFSNLKVNKLTNK